MLNRRTFVSALALGTAATAVKPMAASAAINEASSLNRPFTRSEVLQTSPFYIERYVEEPGNVEFAQYTLKVVDPMGNAQFMIWGSAKPGNEAGAAYVFPGTSQENWKMIQEENGTAFVFSSKRPLELIVPFGTLDTEKGRLKAGDTINTMGATWRPKNPNYQPQAQPAPAAPVNNPPPAAPPADGPPADTGLMSCPLTAQEAARMGGSPDEWTKHHQYNGWVFRSKGGPKWIRVPGFGGMDTDEGQKWPNEVFQTHGATFWCDRKR